MIESIRNRAKGLVRKVVGMGVSVALAGMVYGTPKETLADNYDNVSQNQNDISYSASASGLEKETVLPDYFKIEITNPPKTRKPGCGDCVAVAVNYTAEIVHKMITGEEIKLSEQDYIDAGVVSCETGGRIPDALEHIEGNGVSRVDEEGQGELFFIKDYSQVGDNSEDNQWMYDAEERNKLIQQTLFEKKVPLVVYANKPKYFDENGVGRCGEDYEYTGNNLHAYILRGYDLNKGVWLLKDPTGKEIELGMHGFEYYGYNLAECAMTINMPYAIELNEPKKQTQETSINLNEGWNLVSSPLEPVDKNVGSVLEGIATESAWKWDAKNKGWKVNFPGKSNEEVSAYLTEKGFAPLTEINAGEGFWINSAYPQTLYLKGTEVVDQSITFEPGWNLTGLKSDQSTGIPKFIEGNENNIASVWKWVNGSWEVHITNEKPPGLYALKKGFNELQEVNPGEGIWVNVNGLEKFVLNPDSN